MDKQRYDLEDRLLEFSSRIINLVELLPNSRAGNHIAGQLIRSGTSPYANHGEAQAAESSRDFTHKMRICLKELRESKRWKLSVESSYVNLFHPRTQNLEPRTLNPEQANQCLQTMN